MKIAKIVGTLWNSFKGKKTTVKEPTAEKWSENQTQHFKAIFIWILLTLLWLVFVSFLRTNKFFRTKIESQEPTSLTVSELYKCLFYPGQKLVAFIYDSDLQFDSGK